MKSKRQSDSFMGRLGIIFFIALALAPAFILGRYGFREPHNRFVVKAIAHEWWWEFQYPSLGIAHSRELHLPAGTPVHFELISADVLHSFWFPALKDPIKLLPDLRRTFELAPQRLGNSSGSCDPSCGCSGVCMRFQVFVDDVAHFSAWTSRARKEQFTARQQLREPPPCVGGKEHPRKRANSYKSIRDLLGNG